MARYHGNEGQITFGSVAWDARLVGFTAESSVAEMEGAKQRDTHTNTRPGLKAWSVKATFFLDDTVAPPEAGVSASATFRYKDASTDGTITGTFVVTNSSMPYQLNNDVAIDVMFKNQGAVTVTAPS